MQLCDAPKHAGLLVQAASDLQRLEEDLLLGRAEAVAAVDLAMHNLGDLNGRLKLKVINDIIDGYAAARAELIEIDPQTLPKPAKLRFLATRLGLLELCTVQLAEHLRVADAGIERSLRRGGRSKKAAQKSGRRSKSPAKKADPQGAPCQGDRANQETGDLDP